MNYWCSICGGLIDPESLERFKAGVMGRCLLCRHFGLLNETEDTSSQTDLDEEKSDRLGEWKRDRELDKDL